jgi:hypothetical protein
VSTTLKKDAVTEVLEKVVAEKGPDYVYPYYSTQCFYSDPEDREAPSCIVGHVVAALDHDAFVELAGYERDNGESLSASQLGSDGYAEFEDDTLRSALQAAQEVQDQGSPWSEALEAYRRVLGGEEAYRVTEEISERRYARLYPNG